MKTINIYILSFLLFLVSCHDSKEKVKPDMPTGETIGVTFVVETPSTISPSTYGMTDQMENEIKTVDVLAFKIESGVEKFAYHVKASSITDDGSFSKKKFEVTVLKSQTPQRFVVIANARTQLEGLGQIDQSGEKNAILERLLYSNTGKWNATNASDFTSITMWGESDEEIVDDNTEEIIGTKLLRMVSRIDVNLTTSEVLDTFQLKEIYVYNRNTKGHIVPNSSNLDASGTLVEYPTIPEESGRITEYIKYNTPTTTNIGFNNEIYIFESEAVNENEDSKATCIVVGGIYLDDDKPTYYRVDFRDKSTQKYIDILRNHVYKINIISVTGSGYTDPDEAFNAKAINMKAEIIPWNEYDMKDVVFDGQYLLSVSQGLFELKREAQKDILLKIFTDYPKGWTASVPDSTSSWLSIQNPLNGPADVTTNMTFKVTENDTGEEREGFIIITAGRLKYYVKIVQGVSDAISLMLTDESGIEISELIFPSYFYGGIPEPININLIWTPTGAPCYASKSQMSTYTHFEHNDATACPAYNNTYSGGTQPFVILPTVMTQSEIDEDPFKEKISKYEFTTNNGSSYLSKIMYLRQVHYSIITFEEDNYDMDGNQKSFIVKSNAAWTATYNKGDKDVIDEIITKSGGPNETGEPFYFKMVLNDNKEYNDYSIITFKSPEGKFPDTDVYINVEESVIPIKIGESNCYLVEPSTGVEFPVNRANKDGIIRIKDNDILGYEIIWTDSPNGVGKQGAVAKVSISGTGADARMTVIAGESEGNTVVAVTVDGKIRWSWHIWTTDYLIDEGETFDGNGFIWMDRNLGALSAEPAKSETLGLLYQWGRKDPFPGAAGILDNFAKTIYNANKGIVYIEKKEFDVENNLENAIENPTFFYIGNSNSFYDWYTNKSNKGNSSLWNIIENGKNVKTVYDPCPYGWIIPSNGYNAPWDVSGIGNWNFGASWIDYGWNKQSYGYYPAAGMMDQGSGDFKTDTKVGEYGLYWTGYASATNIGKSMMFNSTNVDHGQSYYRSNALSVRCVKYEAEN